MSTTSRPIASDTPDGTPGNNLSELVAAYEDECFAIEPASEAEMPRHLMEAKSVTQAQLRADTTISKSTISEILAGNKPFSRHVIRKLADPISQRRSLRCGGLAERRRHLVVRDTSDGPVMMRHGRWIAHGNATCNGPNPTCAHPTDRARPRRLPGYPKCVEATRSSGETQEARMPIPRVMQYRRRAGRGDEQSGPAPHRARASFRTHGP